jgi:hypothetical protein
MIHELARTSNDLPISQKRVPAVVMFQTCFDGQPAVVGQYEREWDGFPHPRFPAIRLDRQGEVHLVEAETGTRERASAQHCQHRD